jgi:hypothetical protein
MPSQTDFNLSPYFDDFDETKKFHRILFRPGYAVQARELTQLQTILQNQVERFGNHIFKNGSMVIPGDVNIDTSVQFAKLDETFNTVDVTTYLLNFRNKVITGVTSGVKATVLDTSECDCMVAGDSSIPSLFFKIKDTASDGTTKRFVPGETLTAFAADNTTTTNFLLTTNQIGDISVKIKSFADNGGAATTFTNNSITDVLGNSFAFEVKEGVYFIDGTFVKNSELHLYISRFTTNVSARVGFEITEETITPEEDTSLNDNAQGSSNFAAPGAHRLKIILSLKRLPIESEDQIRFVELLRVKNGNLQQIIKNTQYAELEKTFARRTHDESGSYEVNKFKMSVREHLNDGTNNGVFNAPPASPEEGTTYGSEDKIAIAIDPGKAYVEGYEIERIQTQFVSLDRARPVDGVENGHVARLDDQPIGTPVGNYILINTVRGVPQISNFSTIYLWDGRQTHTSVPTIGSTTNSGKTNLIGTARVRSFELHSNSYNSSSLYKLSLFDIKMESGFSFERDVKWLTDVGRTNTINFFAYTEQATDYVTVTGSANGTITSTNDPIIGTGTRFLDDFKIGDVVVLNDNFVGFVSSIVSANLLLLDRPLTAALITSSGTLTLGRGNARIYDSEFDSLLYKTGKEVTKTLRGFDSASGQDILKSSTQEVRRVITETANVSGIFQTTLANANEFFLSDQNIENYTLFDNTTKQIVNLTSAAITFDNDSNRKVVSISGLTASRSYTLITTIFQSGTVASERTKTLTNSGNQDIVGAKNVTAKNIELPHADVYEIVSVSMRPGFFDSYSTSGAVDITDRFTLDDGQRTTHYQKASLVLKEGAGVPTGALRVNYKYFAYSGSGNYFSVDSYSLLDYKDIPKFRTRNKDNTTQEVFLHDCIDYRPVISGLNSFTPEIPKIGSDFETSISNFLPRFDKIYLDSAGNLNSIKGSPSTNPKEPEDPKEGMILATIFLPAFTKNASDVRMVQKDNRRYTMRDIGLLERRISNLEYYTTLNILEKSTESLSIKDEITGLDKFKNGFIVDQFTGHGVGNVIHPDYKISVDSQNRQLRPMHYTDSIAVVENLTSGLQRSDRDYQKTGDLITLPYTEDTFIFNPNASRSLDVNPYKTGAFNGEITLVPEVDNWKDTDRRPDLVVTDDNNLDAIRFIGERVGITGTQWGEWSTNWTGSTSVTENAFTVVSGFTTSVFQNTITTDTGSTTREGIQTSAVNTTNSVNYGDRIVDISYIPYMRSIPILFYAQNLKPDTKFYPFFDEQSVSSTTKPVDIFTVTKVVGSADLNFNLDIADESALSTDPARAYNGVFQPAFSAGDVLRGTSHTAVTVTAISNISGTAATSFTLTVSSATGLKPGHWVYLYNFDRTRVNPSVVSNLTVNNVTSTITTYGNNHSKQLQNEIFKISAINGSVLTLVRTGGGPEFNNLESSNLIQPFDAYSTAAYPANDGGKLVKLQGSGVVTSAINLENNITSISLSNIKNGFGVGEVLTGTISTGTGSVNNVTIVSVNGGTSTVSAPTMKSFGDQLRTDENGDLIGTFVVPLNTFRTGDKTFKLTDNISNSEFDFDSTGIANFSATGLTLSKEQTVVSSRNIRYQTDRVFQATPSRRVSTTTRLLSQVTRRPFRHDPLSQTFLCSSAGGAFILGVDLYFEEVGDRPVFVQLVTTNNGIPSTKVLPFSTVVKTASEIDVSSDGSVATRFSFRSPVYLNDNETYAVLIKTDEPGTTLFISELGETDLITSNVISQQPLTGTLYMSQNTQEYVANPKLDLKFRLIKAIFDTSVVADVPLKALPPLPFTLDDNPFEFTPNTLKVRIKARNHGFSSGNIVVISNVANGVYGGNGTNGANEGLLNGSHTVLSDGLTKDSFLIELQNDDGVGNTLLVGTTANFIKGFYGGSGIICTRQLNLDIMYYKSNDLFFTDTSIRYYAIAQNSAGDITGELPFVANQDYNFDERKIIKSFENETLITSNPLVKSPTLTFNVELTSTNQNLSPVIDLQQLSVYAISNLVDNKTSSNLNVDIVDERALIEDGGVLDTDTYITGTGTITTTTSSSTITGASTLFQTEVRVGDTIRVGNTAIGVVTAIAGNTSLTISANALATNGSGVAYKIVGRSVIEIDEDANGNGTLTTWIDAADNILANAQIGAKLKIEGVLSSKIDGTYTIKNVIEEANIDRFAGSADGNKVTITLDGTFTSLPTTNTIYLDVVNDWYEFNLNGTHVSNVASATITSTADNTSRINAGDVIVSTTIYQVVNPDGGSEQRLEKKVLGTVSSVTSNSIVLTGVPTIGDGSTQQVLAVRKTGLNWAIKQYDSFVDDFAPTGSTNLANYITRTLSLTEPANNIRILFDANIPQFTDLKVYYRTFNDINTDLSKLRWSETGFTVSRKDSVDIFSEREIEINNITEFKNLAIKIVFKSTNNAYVPKVKALRVVAFS